jgi:hypothetical protein
MRWALAAMLAATAALSAPAGEALGYTDTPQIPGQPWKVHDGTRPQPPVIQAPAPKQVEGKPDQIEPAKPPSDAIVLFDGVDNSKWGNTSGGAPWKVADGALVAEGNGDLISKESFGDCHLHIEWSTPKPPRGSGQSRCNSGIFMMGMYEIQVLDSYQNKTYPDGNAGAIYGQYPPLVNATVPPGEWNVFDILFTAPRFEDKKLKTPAYVTVLHNGVVIHNHVALLGPAQHRKNTEYAEHGETGSILLQSLNSGVRYRNIWVRPLKGYDSNAPKGGEAPSVAPPAPPNKTGF